MKAVKPNVVEDPTPLVPPVLQFYDYYTLNRQSAFNRALIVETPECGCFHCGSRFPGSKVSKWLDEGDKEMTALCPYCGDDTVVVGTTELPLSTALLTKLYIHWFEKEHKEREGRATVVPHFSGFDDYLRKGIPFLLGEDENRKVVGTIQLFNLAMLEFDPYAPEEPTCDDLESTGSDERSGLLEESEEPVEPFGGLIDVLVRLDEGGGKLVKFMDCTGANLHYEPWSGPESVLVEELYDQYGSRLKGLVKNPHFSEMTLLIIAQ